jgi:hypothetical protein
VGAGFASGNEPGSESLDPGHPTHGTAVG